jgi:hypothetical protein
MPKPDFISQLQHRLLELGCPKAQARRLVREVVDHRDDLRQAARSEGLSGENAERQVSERLGDPLTLADQQMAMLLRSSWLGRHYVMGFGLLPLLAVPVLWMVLLLAELMLGYALGYGWNEKRLHAVSNNAVQLYHLILTLNGADCIAIALIAVFFCWLARRLVVRPTWMWIACVICSLYALFSGIHLEPHHFTVSLRASWPPQRNFDHGLQVFKAALPLLVGGATCVLQWRTARHFRSKLAV